MTTPYTSPLIQIASEKISCDNCQMLEPSKGSKRCEECNKVECAECLNNPEYSEMEPSWAILDGHCLCSMCITRIA